MNSNEKSYEKYFSFMANNHQLSPDDLELLDSDDPMERKIKTYFSEKKNNYKDIKIEDIKSHDSNAIENEINDLNEIFNDLLNYDEKNKNDIVDALTHALTEITEFILHEPDPNFLPNQQEREKLQKLMTNTMKSMGVTEDQSKLYESIFPEVGNQIGLIMAKLRTPRA